MEPTQDGFVHQSRQDDHFERLENFAEYVLHHLLGIVAKRDLTREETDIIHRAAQLSNETHIYRVAGGRIPKMRMA